jgi:hypothetical protein
LLNRRDPQQEESPFLLRRLRIKRWIKEKIWLHIPGRAFLYFCYLYFLRLGLLDGRHAFKFCLMHAVFEQFTTLKLWELKNYKKEPITDRIDAPSVFWNFENSYRKQKQLCHEKSSITGHGERATA